MIPDDFMVCVAGRASDGSYSTASIFAKVAERHGYYVHEQRDVQSNISGLHSAFYVRASKNRCYGKSSSIDILIVFDGEAFNERIGELNKEGIVIYDSSPRNPCHKGVPVVIDSEKNPRFFGLPMADLARENLSDTKMRNTIALGVLSYLLGMDREIFVALIEKQYRSKKGGKEIVENNLKAYDIGESYARENRWELPGGGN